MGHPSKILNAYTGRRVLVTGHTGFKGSWLCTWLKMLGAEVYGFALPPEQPERCLFFQARVGDDLDSTIGDLGDPQAVQAVCQQQPEVVFHLAAQALVRRGYQQPVETFASNVMGTVNLLQALRTNPALKAVVVITSDKCYADRNLARGYREEDHLGGVDPYSASKACAEHVVAAYRQSYFQQIPVATARAGNVIGGGDWACDRLLPDLIEALCDRRNITLRYPDASRPWQHVLDPLYGYLLLGARLLGGDPLASSWNFGPPLSATVPVRAIASSVLSSWGPSETELVWESPEQQPHETHTLKLDASKAQQHLDWQPALTLEQAIEWTVLWYRTWFNNSADMYQFTKQQIDNYQDRLTA